MSEVRRDYIDAGEHRIHVRSQVRDEARGAPPVVLVHGLVVSSRYMVPLIRTLGTRFPVYAPDLPGFGNSSRPKKTLDLRESADALAQIISALGLSKVVLVANSLGCQTAVEFALRHRARTMGLVLQGPTVDAHARTRRQQAWRWLKNGQRERPAQLPLLVADYAQAGIRRAIESFRIALADKVEEKLPRVEVPALVVRGGQDPIVSQHWAEEVTALLPRGRLVVIPGGPHTLNFARPLELARVSAPFIDALAEGRT